MAESVMKTTKRDYVVFMAKPNAAIAELRLAFKITTRSIR
jgi:hypothetical protein